MNSLIDIVIGIWFLGGVIVFVTGMLTWGKILGTGHIVLVTIVSLFWPIYLPLTLLGEWRHRNK